MEKINYEMRDKIIKAIPDLQKCFQCGTCASSCLSSKYSTQFNPRKIILDSVHGFQNNVMNDHLWKCSTCHKCNERCPQEVNPYDVIVKLKNFAVKEKLCSPAKLDELDKAYNYVLDTGVSFSVTELTQRTRKELGLKELDTKQLRTLVK